MRIGVKEAARERWLQVGGRVRALARPARGRRRGGRVGRRRRARCRARLLLVMLQVEGVDESTMLLLLLLLPLRVRGRGRSVQRGRGGRSSAPCSRSCSTCCGRLVVLAQRRGRLLLKERGSGGRVDEHAAVARLGRHRAAAPAQPREALALRRVLPVAVLCPSRLGSTVLRVGLAPTGEGVGPRPRPVLQHAKELRHEIIGVDGLHWRRLRVVFFPRASCRLVQCTCCESLHSRQ